MLSPADTQWSVGFPGCAHEAATRDDLSADQREAMTAGNIAALMKIDF